MVVSARVCSRIPAGILAHGATRRAVVILRSDQHLCLADSLLDPRQRPSTIPHVFRPHKPQPYRAGTLNIGIRSYTHSSSQKKEGFLPQFYLVSSWCGNEGHNKQPKPASLRDFRPEIPTCFIVHGVFGCGKNWLPFVQKHLSNSFPEWQFVLLDSRGHGESIGASEPHTLRECAEDIARLAAALGRAPDITIGHSLGGEPHAHILKKSAGLCSPCGCRILCAAPI
jgi:pimeloyl-ACP methyl ester carboxylesterase